MSLHLLPASRPERLRVACVACGAHWLLLTGGPLRGCTVCGCCIYEEVDARA